MTCALASTCNVTLLLSMLVEVTDGTDDREHPGFLGTSQEAHHSSWGRSSGHKSDQSSLHSTMKGTSSRSNRSVHAGRDL